MAKLGSYYALCPIIDTKSILGITEDAEKGFVIATLDKNIASKYKLSDQKQIVCWRTREKFSSPVLYVKTLSKYVAVFNQSYIKVWDAEENLDKVKKYKFNKPIHTIFNNSDSTYIVFQNGSVYRLQEALDERKTLHPSDIFDGEIVDVLYKKLKDSLYVALIVVENEEYHLHWTVLNDGKAIFNKIDLNREDLALKGWAFHVWQDRMNFLSCWSDQSIFSTALDDNEAQNTIGDLFTVVDSVSMKHKVSLTPLDENYVALFGANSNEEGAVLVLYNTQFKVTQTKQPFKLFNENSRIWLVDNNLILPVGQNLAVIPFYLETEQLAALIGSHKALNDRLDADINIVTEVEVSSWDAKIKVEEKNIPALLQTKVDIYIEQGYPESLVLEELLPDILKNNDVDMLNACLQFFSDIPEKCLARILQYLLTANPQVFLFKKCSIENFPPGLQPLQRKKLIDKIMSISYSETILLPHLKAMLTLKDLKPLLEYICYAWESDEFLLPNLNAVETEKKLMEWSCILIDANYQKIVLSKDEEILEVFYKLRKLVDQSLAYLEECEQLEPILRTLIKGKYQQKDYSCNLRYSIEQLSLY
ncbi:unnamed protein product [Acanthoscelides obtectus]|uniref:Nucleolar protein 11 n=1 Tax=Acanthoscelides obtectus TaxID=200917 RepID=A0A9P0M419_ACAOB|nr:unnamed protein product [Acanthoscelides obtectus]CAK1636231.1 Nucleolar protein 11 [Acanthoscelides obtectus]